MIHIKEYSKEFTAFYKEKYIFFIAFLIIVPILSLATIYGYIEFADNAVIKLCAADYYVVSASNLMFYISLAILPNIFISNFIKSINRINYVIKQKSLKHLWLKQACFSFITTLLAVIYQFIVTTIIAMCAKPVLINFNQKRSLFALMNEGITTNNMTFTKVVVASFIFSVFMAFLMNVLYLLIKWLLNYDIICFFTLLIIALCDMYANVGFCRKLGVSYSNLISYNPLLLLIPFICLVALIFIGSLFSEHKEFLHAK